MILPLYAGLDRIIPACSRRPATSAPAGFDVLPGDAADEPADDRRRADADRLPMPGDYFTNDLLSASPEDVDGRQPDERRRATPGQAGQAGAFVMLVFLVAAAARCSTTSGSPRMARRRGRPAHERAPRPRGGTHPWRRRTSWPRSPRLYLAWSLLPVLVAVLFSFNAGRSRSTWQGFSLRWYFGDPNLSVWHDDSLRTALLHTLQLGVHHHAGRRPARGGVRARPGPLARPAAGHGELRDAAVVRGARDRARGRRCCSWSPGLASPFGLGTAAQVVGLVTFQMSYPVVIVAARLLTIGRHYEEAALDLGAHRSARSAGCCCRCSTRRSSPARCWCSPT